MSSMVERAQTFGEIQDYLVTSARALFEAYGMEVEYSSGGSAEIDGPAVMAVIGFADVGVRGTLLLLTPRDIVDALTPPEVRASGVAAEDSLRDVLGEFANMLLGRIKNQLVTRDIAPLLTTPTTVYGDDLKLPAPTSGMSAWHTFAGAMGNIFVRFDATVGAEFALAPVGEGKPTPIAEGEMLLF
jgi:CheY-specific phosphatase CheX